MSDAWGAWNSEKKDWYRMAWTPGIRVPQLMEREEMAEALVRDLGEGWEVKKTRRDK
jgi:hypothetical protein